MQYGTKLTREKIVKINLTRDEFGLTLRRCPYMSDIGLHFVLNDAVFQRKYKNTHNWLFIKINRLAIFATVDVFKAFCFKQRVV